MFRYFATVSVDGVPYMRPSDFIRSLTPGELQPTGVDFFVALRAIISLTSPVSEYGLDVFQPLTREKAAFRGGSTRLLRYDAEGNVTNDDDLISYAEYVFLLTCLSSACGGSLVLSLVRSRPTASPFRAGCSAQAPVCDGVLHV